MKPSSYTFIVLVGLTMQASLMAQSTVNPYFMNGSATQDNCNCYTLTQDVTAVHGSVWNVNKIDLTQPIDFKFSVYLGSHDAYGADGIAFVLQPISTQIGTAGGGIGLQGVKPSIAIVLDTWQNLEYNDPAYDHISITANGDLNHITANNLDGPVQILSGRDNAEDAQWHLLYVKWDPTTKTLSASMDDIPRVSIKKDLVAEIFNGDPMVFWGFTGSTGGYANLQRFCTALNPGFKTMATQEFCLGKPVQFLDSSNSFSKIVSWNWNLGDGTTFKQQDPPPHTYATPGNYDIKLVINGNNGCTSDTALLKITVKAYPFAKIGYTPQPYCENDPLTLLDSSSVDYGTVNNWTWKTSSGDFTTRNPTLPGGLGRGTETVSLTVRTKEGCISSPVTRTLSIFPKPKADFTANNACVGDPVNIHGADLEPASPASKWFWNLGDGTTSTLQDPPPHTYAAPGYYDIKMVINGNNGCTSDTALLKITIGTYPFAKIGYTPQPYCENDPLTLLDSSSVDYGTVNNWTWKTSSGDFTTRNLTLPGGLGRGTETVSLTVRTKEGCISSPVTRKLSILSKPNADFTANNACVGDPVNIHGADLDPASPVGKWVWDLGDGRYDSSGSSLAVQYDQGNDYNVTLKATGVNGCEAKLLIKPVSIWQTHAYAGRDTIVATGQPLQLNGSGGILYKWSPTDFLSDPNVPDPIALPDHDMQYTLTAFTPAGCPTTDNILVKVFKGPAIYVPTAFTPNGDGRNDVLHVIPIGVQLDYFRIYDRWGNMVFFTIDRKKGWDGTFNGMMVPGNYVWMVQGRDFNGQLITKSGLLTLIL